MIGIDGEIEQRGDLRVRARPNEDRRNPSAVGRRNRDVLVNDEPPIRIRLKQRLDGWVEIVIFDHRLPRGNDVGGAFAMIQRLARARLLRLRQRLPKRVHVAAHPAVRPRDFTIGQASVELGESAAERVRPGLAFSMIAPTPRIDAPRHHCIGAFRLRAALELRQALRGYLCVLPAARRQLQPHQRSKPFRVRRFSVGGDQLVGERRRLRRDGWKRRDQEQRAQHEFAVHGSRLGPRRSWREKIGQRTMCGGERVRSAR
jgi:hypothetical protein